MTTSEATATMILLFALRCLVPLVLILGIGYVMNWLVDKWELEAERERLADKVPETAVLPAKRETCWSIIKCDPEQQKKCPGFQNQKIPCWLARTQAEGALPERCLGCPLYLDIPAFT